MKSSTTYWSRWTHEETDKYTLKISYQNQSTYFPLTIESITYEESDQLTLKSEYDAKILALETENAALKAQILTLKPKYPWQESYPGFTERIEQYGDYDIAYWVCYRYNDTNNYNLDIQLGFPDEKMNAGEYLLIVADTDFNIQYIRHDFSTMMLFFNEHNDNISPREYELTCSEENEYIP